VSDVTISVDGRTMRVEEGTTVAAAMVGAGITAFRDTASGNTRGPLCGMGTCYECRLTIDGVAHQRACLRVVTQGMVVQTHG
jgi:sarcosine oxidase subunit alpha